MFTILQQHPSLPHPSAPGARLLRGIEGKLGSDHNIAAQHPQGGPKARQICALTPIFRLCQPFEGSSLWAAAQTRCVKTRAAESSRSARLSPKYNLLQSFSPNCRRTVGFTLTMTNKYICAIFFAPTLAFSQLVAPPPGVPILKNAVAVNKVPEVLEATHPGAGDFGYPAATDTTGFGLGDAPDLIERNAGRLGYKLRTKREYSAGFGLPSRIGMLEFDGLAPGTALRVQFSSTGKSRALFIDRSESFGKGLSTEALQAQIRKKYGEPSFISADGVSEFTWKSNDKGRMNGGGAVCEPPYYGFAQSNYKTTNCKFGISVSTQTLQGDKRIATFISVRLADIFAISADFSEFNQLVNKYKNEEAEKAKGVVVPKI